MQDICSNSLIEFQWEFSVTIYNEVPFVKGDLWYFYYFYFYYILPFALVCNIAVCACKQYAKLRSTNSMQKGVNLTNRKHLPQSSCL